MNKVSKETADKLNTALWQYEKEAETSYMAMPVEMYRIMVDQLTEASQRNIDNSIAEFERVTGEKFHE